MEKQIFTCFNFRAILGHVHLENPKMALENMALNSLKWPFNQKYKDKDFKFSWKSSWDRTDPVETVQTKYRCN